MMDVNEHGTNKEDRIDVDLLMQNSRNIDAFLTVLYIVGGTISGNRSRLHRMFVVSCHIMNVIIVTLALRRYTWLHWLERVLDVPVDRCDYKHRCVVADEV